MALTEVKFTALQIFQATLERDIKEVLIAFYGEDYRKILAKGKVLADAEHMKVLEALEELEKDLGINLAKGEKL